MKLIIIVGVFSLAAGLSLGAFLRWRDVRGGTVSMVLALVTLIAGALLLSFSAPEIGAEIETRTWPTTDGTISDTTRVGQRAILPLITYTYQVAGVSYTDSTDLDVPGFGSKRYRGQTAEKILEAYPPGKSVTVRYNPNNPKKSALRPGLRWAPLMRFTLGAMLLMTFGAIAPIARWKRPQS